MLSILPFALDDHDIKYIQIHIFFEGDYPWKTMATDQQTEASFQVTSVNIGELMK